MKRIGWILLAVMMVLGVSCGKKAGTVNAIETLYRDGYDCMASTADETQWKGMFCKDGNYESVFLVSAPLNAALYEQFDAIGWEDEEGKKNFLFALTDVTATERTDLVPTEAELASYAGKTLGELEDLGWTSTGWVEKEEGGYRFTYDGPVFYASIDVAETVTDIDDLSPNAMRALTVKTMIFGGISAEILEQE